MTQGKRISANIGSDALKAIQELGAAAKLARSGAGEGQAAAAARLGVHVQTIGRIEAGEPGVSIGHVLGLLALYGIFVRIQQPESRTSHAPAVVAHSTANLHSLPKGVEEAPGPTA